MAETVRLPLFDLPRVMRAYSAVATAAADEDNWECVVELTSHVFDEMTRAVHYLLANIPVAILNAGLEPSNDRSCYDAIVYVDASASGFGAYVALKDGIVWEVKGGWNSVIEHSAHAEPRAASTVLQWLRARLPQHRHVAVVTDHQPMATAQRRWYNRHGGFSGAWPLNTFFAALYHDHDDARRDVFYSPGEQNVADALSRSNRIGDGVRAVPAPSSIQLPSLATFWHPHAQRPDRPLWMV
jgi:hypothetical protein